MCDARRTEPAYFEALRQHKRLGRLRVHRAAGIDPQRLVAEVPRLREEAEADGDPYTEVWCVFDHDQRGGVAGTVAAALKAKLNVAYSDPCFEIWYLQHYRYSTAVLTTDQAIAELAKVRGHYEKADNLYDELLEQQPQAIANAENLRAYHEANRDPDRNCPETNPSTTVDQLVLHLNEIAPK